MPGDQQGLSSIPIEQQQSSPIPIKQQSRSPIPIEQRQGRSPLPIEQRSTTAQSLKDQTAPKESIGDTIRDTVSAAAEYVGLSTETEGSTQSDLKGKLQNLKLDDRTSQDVAQSKFQSELSKGKSQLHPRPSVPIGQQQELPVSQIGLRESPVDYRTVQKDVVVQESIHPSEETLIQPVIHREREQLDVRQVTELRRATETQPVTEERRELPAERRETINQRGIIEENVIQPSRTVDDVVRTERVLEPIIEETITRRVVEEVQPVLKKDVYVPSVVKTTLPIYEKVVEPARVFKEERIASPGKSGLDQRQPQMFQSK